MNKVQLAKSPEAVSKIIDLRYAVLREPWNKAYETATDELEEESVNAYISHNEKVIACGRLQDNGNGLGQIRFMAVAPEFQGKGLGKLILRELENEAKKMGLNKIELQARENALQFYKSEKYELIEKSFKLWDIIQHYLMAKHL